MVAVANRGRANSRDVGTGIGFGYEQGGIIKDGAKMINAVSNSTVPHVTITMGASYGAGNYGMCGRSYSPRFLFAWPNSKSAVMGPAQLAGVLSIVARESAADRGLPFDEDADAQMRAAVEEQIERESVALANSGRLYDDGIIDPRRGMRVVTSPDELEEAVASASREAAAAFSDGTVFLERYIQRPRHVEIQVMADTHGNVVALFERECSVQRRHQKVIEEAPSPVVDEELRARMSEAAVAAARAVGYVGAGTVEFVYDVGQDGMGGSFAFLEMNTRLQVEHPVTELITGLDLVRAQLLVAMGRALPDEMCDTRVRGHAIEARLCAEDPADDYRPCAGTLRTIDIPALAGVRVDSGFRAGSGVSHHYDSLLAKVIAWAPTREEARSSFSAALAGARIHGVTTNRDLLVRTLRHDEFAGRGTDTGFLQRHDVAELGAPLADSYAEGLHAIAATVAGVAARRAVAPLQASLPAGWRNNSSQPQTTTWRTQTGRDIRVGYTLHPMGTSLSVDDQPSADVAVVVGSTESVVLSVGGVRRTFHVLIDGDLAHVDSVLGYTALSVVPRFVDPSTLTPPGSLTAPMPGSVIRLPVVAGETVSAGQTLVVLEAMKMEHSLASPIDGVLSALPVEVGNQVSTGDVLAVVEAVDGDEVPSDATEP